MRKLLFTAASVAIIGGGLFAQNGRKVNGRAVKAVSTPVTSNSRTGAPAQGNPNRCGTLTPDPRWDAWFNQEVEKFKAARMGNNSTTASTYTIPVVFHIIYDSGTEATEGTGHNITQAQVNSQIPIINADYAGTGYNSSQYAGMTMSGHPAFYDYAVANSLLAPDNNGTIIANSGITFCLATKNPSGTTLAEPGIDRQSWSTNGWGNPATTSNLMNLFDGTIKPATIWDPTKYFNVWVSDGSGSNLLGYSTFPPGTTLTGLPSTGTSTTDGVWVNYTAVGNVGAAAAPYNLGRTLTHESGHYFGLRHIWGDGNCLTDYCNDTPPAAAANFNSWPVAYPFHSGTCAGPPSNAPDGEMFMNFMDYVADAAMWMFTTDQVARFQTALAQSPYRSGLTASSANLCTGVTVVTPTASFSFPSQICTSSPMQFTDNSSGPPSSWSWSVTPTATITTPTSQNPTITFSATGTYSVTLTATNSQGSGSITHTISAVNCSITYTVCPDTLRNFKNTDTITVFSTANGTVTALGSSYVSGNNAYGDLEKGEFFTGTGLPSNPMVTGGIYLYYRNATANKGTRGTSIINLNMYNATSTAGPTGAAVATHTVAINTITALTPTTSVRYCGNDALAFATAIIYPYDFNFPTPHAISGGFIMSTTLPPNGTDTAVVFSSTGKTASASTAWEKQTGGTWYPFNNGTTTTWQLNCAVACLPKISCTTGFNGPNAIGNHIAMFPNPSDGNFNFAVTMPESTDLTFTVMNALGQTVYSKVERGVTNGIINIDIGDKAKGVYYVSVVSDKSSVVLKAIVR